MQQLQNLFNLNKTLDKGTTIACSLFTGGEIEYEDSDGSEFLEEWVCPELGNPHGPTLPDLGRAPGPSGHICVGLLLWVKTLHHRLH